MHFAEAANNFHCIVSSTSSKICTLLAHLDTTDWDEERQLDGLMDLLDDLKNNSDSWATKLIKSDNIKN